MTFAFAIIISELVFFLSALLAQLLSVLSGAFSTVSVNLVVIVLLFGLVMSILLARLQHKRYTYPLWVLFLLAVALTILISAFAHITGKSWGVIVYVNFYLSMIFALFSIRSILKRLSLTRSEELPLILTRFLRMCGLMFFVSIILLPFYFMIFLSITPRAIFLQNPLNLAPRFSLGIGSFFLAYVEVMTTFNFGRYILNSLLVSVVSVILTMIPATLGAYAVTRLKFPGQKLLSRSILLIYMFPSIVLAIPLYSVFATLGLRDSLVGLLIVYPAITIPVSLYMLRNYFQTLPRDIEEAGIIDGCSRLSVIRRITLPLSFPALLAVGLYIFMIAWNEFLFAFMFLDKQSIFTLSRGIVSLNSQEVPRQFLMAGAIIITTPVMVIFFSLERYFTGGLVAGGVKG